MLDSQHRERGFRTSEIEHRYGEGVHIQADPVALSQLARLCSRDTHQPEINDLVEDLYRSLLHRVVSAEFPTRRVQIESRMQAVLSPDAQAQRRGIIEAELLDRTTPVVTVDIARAGILPSLTCYQILNRLLDPRGVRQDHLIVSRAVDAADHVIGARITGQKIGGPVDGRIILFPDPMGATGSSLSTAISYYKQEFGGAPAKLITLNLIITPEFVRRIHADHPEVLIYALRLDRGMSDPEVLASVPGTYWDREVGLNDHDYIVPGGGGFGEIMNNAWI
jgi:uracil phosphoribosyltransferase